MNRQDILVQFQALQDRICEGLQAFDPQMVWQEDQWNRPGGGGGRSRAGKEGAIWQKGGVNFSDVHGVLNEALRVQLKTKASSFQATGVSLVLHPLNPHVPIVHMNVRHFRLDNGQEWFGGGMDLTPHYVEREEASLFHRSLKTICDQFDSSWYAAFKNLADDYFYLPHREETRGVGGVFFDELGASPGANLDQAFAFVQAIGNGFLPTYLPLVERKKDWAVQQRHLDWQNMRRGRYVEFNLVHDRGTRFGLVSNGRTESILMSMPPHADWAYNHCPLDASDEADTQAQLKKGMDWLGES
tara:strand:+ start:719 stop:1618 length:900 start_codon:yes stop_codon:yes gene_type:complete